MPDKDSVTKRFMQDKAIFADAFNFLIYHGEPVIRPEQLRPLDTTAVALPYGEDGRVVPVQKYRDVLKLVTAMEDDHAAYLLLGIENQSEIHYAMPARNMLYDALQYAAQISEAAKRHRKDGQTGDSPAEFLSGFRKTDKLLPVITLTVYFGPDEWDAPTSLFGMLRETDPQLLKFVPDYRMNLLAPAGIGDAEFDLFRSELSQAMKFLKYSNDKDALNEAMSADERFRAVSKETVDLLNAVANAGIPFEKGKEKIDMCEAIRQIRQDGYHEGQLEGRAQGMAQGMAQGVAQGKTLMLYELLKKGLLQPTDAAGMLGCSVQELEEKLRTVR